MAKITGKVNRNTVESTFRQASSANYLTSKDVKLKGRCQACGNVNEVGPFTVSGIKNSPCKTVANGSCGQCGANLKFKHETSSW